MKKNEIYKIYGKNYKEMTMSLLEQSELIDRIPDQCRIGIKPNLVSPTPAQYGATTHPEIVAGIIEYLQKNGQQNIVIMESSWVGDKTSEAYEYCGYREICEKYNVEFIDVQKEKSETVECAGMKLKICDRAKEIDFLINVPVLKGHGQTRITCALKNMKGLIPNAEKRHFHTMGLHKPIAHLSTMIHQDFIVIDHICGDLELEDGGNPIERNCLMTALDPVLVDSYVCHMLGYGVNDVEYVRLAGELGCGSTDLTNCQISVFSGNDESGMKISGKQESAKKNPEKTDSEDPDSLKLIRKFSALEKDIFEERRSPSDNLLDISYAIEDADSCSACYASLAPAILRLKEEGLYEKLMSRLPGRISIGQGFADQTGYIGVGNCCRNFEINIPGCPPDEEEVYEKLKKFLEK